MLALDVEVSRRRVRYAEEEVSFSFGSYLRLLRKRIQVLGVPYQRIPEHCTSLSFHGVFLVYFSPCCIHTTSYYRMKSREICEATNDEDKNDSGV